MTNPVFIKEHVITNNKNNVAFKEKMLNGFNVVTSLMDNTNQGNSIHQTFTVFEEKEEVKEEVVHSNSWASIGTPQYTSIASTLIGMGTRLTSSVVVNNETNDVTVVPHNNSDHYSSADYRKITNNIKEVFDVTAVVIRGCDGKLHNTDSVSYIECCKILFKYARGTFIINDVIAFNDDTIKPIGTVVKLSPAEVQSNCNPKFPFDPDSVTEALTRALLTIERVKDLIFLGVDPFRVTTISKIIEISTEWPANGEECVVELHNHVPVMTVYDKVNYQKMEKLVRYTEYEERTNSSVIKFF